MFPIYWFSFIELGSWYFDPLKNTSRREVLLIMVRSPVITWPVGLYEWGTYTGASRRFELQSRQCWDLQHVLVVEHLGCNMQDLWEGGSTGTSVRDPESQECAHESLKGPIAFVIDVLFWFVHFGRYFQPKSSILIEISACSRGPKAVLFRLAKFLSEALDICVVQVYETIGTDRSLICRGILTDCWLFCFCLFDGV